MATYDDTEVKRAYPDYEEFDYSVWTPNTTVTLTNVPWDSSYRDIVRFDSTQARDTWFSNRMGRADSARLTGFVYLKYGEPVMVPLPFSQCNQMNYLVAENPIQPIPTRSSTPTRKPDKFYYFVQDVQYVAPNTTALIVQLDVWMTYYDRISFGQCYITRGHIAMANQNCTLDTMSSYLQDPEGLEYGDEYDSVYKRMVVFGDVEQTTVDNVHVEGVGSKPMVMIVSNTALHKAFGTESNPKLNTATGCFIGGVGSGAQVYLMHSDDLTTFYNYMSEYPWASQGIVSMTLIPSEMTDGFDGEHPLHLGGTTTSKVPLFYPPKHTPNTQYVHNLVTFSGFQSGVTEDMKSVLKLWQFPYCYIELTTFQGSPVIIKPQYWKRGTSDAGNKYWNIAYRSSLCPPNQKLLFWPTRYNEGGQYADQELTWQYTAADDKKDTARITTGEFINSAVEMSDFPQLPIVNNMYQYYLASTANTRAWQYSNASWAQQKSLTAANNSLNLANASMGNQQANQDVANNLAIKQSGIALEQNAWSGMKGMAGGAIGAAGSLLSGNLGGAASGALSAATAYFDMNANADWTTRTTTNQLAAANQTLGNNLAYQRNVADTNYSYANYAANGDYQQAIQGIQATVRDAQLTQPSVSGQLNGGSYAFQNGLVGYCMVWRRIKPQYLQQLYQYFKRYGYYVNRFIQPPANLKCMTKYTYWQMRETTIFGNIPETFKQTLRGVFESGVTVWNNPDEVGRVAPANNQTISGVSY